MDPTIADSYGSSEVESELFAQMDDSSRTSQSSHPNLFPFDDLIGGWQHGVQPPQPLLPVGLDEFGPEVSNHHPDALQLVPNLEEILQLLSPPPGDATVNGLAGHQYLNMNQISPSHSHPPPPLQFQSNHPPPLSQPQSHLQQHQPQQQQYEQFHSTHPTSSTHHHLGGLSDLAHSDLPTIAVAVALPPDLPIVPAIDLASAGTTNTRPRANYACIPCRKLKASCDNQRPCSRCTARGKECIDRPEEDIKIGMSRKKRPQPCDSNDSTLSTTVSVAAAASPSEATHTLNSSIVNPSHGPHVDPLPTHITMSPSETFQIWSRSWLTHLIQSGVRDSILKLQAKFDMMPVELPNLLEWHTQVSMMCYNFAEQLSVDDFHQFLTHGLSEEVLNSRLWSSSPLAPWSKLSTRPFFGVCQPLPPSAATPPNHPCSQPSEVAELYTEYNPSSNINYSRLLQMQTARILFERQLSKGRIRKQPSPSSTTNQTAHSTPLGSTTAPSSSGSSVASVSEQSNSSDDPEMTSLTESMATSSILEMGSMLLASPPQQLVEVEKERGELCVHARWCPMSQTADPANSNEKKVKRTNLLDSVHASSNHSIASANLDEIPLSDLLASNNSSLRCICSLSTPLPSTVRINAAFERLFGWRRIEIEQHLQMEGIAWFRRLVPVEYYSNLMPITVNHWKSQITYIGEMGLQAAYLSQRQQTNPDAVIDLPPIPPPAPLLPKICRICRKTGEILPDLYQQLSVFSKSDGQSTPTTATSSWKKLVQ